MIYAELYGLHSPDALDLTQYTPEDPSSFGILVEAMIGPQNGVGHETFDFVLCTPSWFAQTLSEGEYRFGHSYIFFGKFDYVLLWRAIKKLCDSVAGPDWETVARRLSRYGKWEFEDYTP
jgi:hypothetical protein